jgi:hypothetical protein
LFLFNVLAAGFYYKYLVLRNLEARFLKTWNLGGFLCAPQEPGATQRVDSENTTLKYMLADSRKQSANGLAAEGADDKGDTLSAGECMLDKLQEGRQMPGPKGGVILLSFRVETPCRLLTKVSL